MKIFYGVETREGTTGNDDLDDFPVDTGDTSMESSANMIFRKCQVTRQFPLADIRSIYTMPA